MGGHGISLTSVNGIIISGNSLGKYGTAGAAARHFVFATTVKDLQVNGNQKYYAGVGYENQLVLGTGLDYVTIVGNHANLGNHTSLNYYSLLGLQIEGLSKAGACVVTWTAHGKQTGDKIRFGGITQAGWIALNGIDYSITYLTANTFSIPVSTSGIALSYAPATDPGTYWFQEIAHNQITNRTP